MFQGVTTSTSTTVPGAASVLTSEFPDAGQMIGWAWSHAAEWAGAHLLLVVLGLVAAVVWYLSVIIRRAIVAI